ncbi:hypothetical protein LQF76_10310 [Gloeomargaritales cyanobacterium VI4D9]|nr:hypothetical protein LQF76_10310 [Gloeomargaritales cyanobacterium VI4D9]
MRTTGLLRKAPLLIHAYREYALVLIITNLEMGLMATLTPMVKRS